MGRLDAFEEQLEYGEPVTEEMIGDDNFITEYESGKEKRVGDVVLFAFLMEDYNTKLIQIHPDEIDVIYEVDYTMSISMPHVPAVKKITTSD